MSKPIIAIIGAGNMGRCLMGGLIQNHYPQDNLWLSNPNINKLTHFKEIHTTTDNRQAANAANIVIFAVKPGIVPQIATELADIIRKRHVLVISVAGGVNIHTIQQSLNYHEAPIVRCMPNIPSLIGCGASALYANSFVSEQQKNQVESILRTLGMVVWLEKEIWMNPVTALSGCGPAYLFAVIEAMQKAGEALGLPQEIARDLTLQTAYGASRMALESEKEVAELINEVASPGGSTIEALRVFQEKDLSALILSAMESANQRAIEREKQLMEAK